MKRIANKKWIALFLSVCLSIHPFSLLLSAEQSDDLLQSETNTTEEATESNEQTTIEIENLQMDEQLSASNEIQEQSNSLGEKTDQANQPSLVNNDAIVFNAGIYSDPDRTDKLVELSNAGNIQLQNWEYGTDRYLGIQLDNLSMDKQYQLVVEMAPILYINLNGEIKHDAATVSYVKNDPLPVNQSGFYELKPYSLKTLTYLINKSTQNMTLGLPVRYDEALWNKTNGAVLSNGEQPLLKVHLEEVTDLGNSVIENCSGALNTAVTKGTISDTPGVDFYTSTNTDTKIMGIDESLRLVVRRSNSIQYKGGYYYDKLKVEMTVPSITIDGIKYELEWKDVRFISADGAIEVVPAFENGVLSISASQLMMGNGALMQMNVSAPDALKEKIGVHVLKGYVTVTADDTNILMNNYPFTVSVDNNMQAKVVSGATAGSANIIDLDTVQLMGGLVLSNQAAASDHSGSGPLEVELQFDINNTNAVGVTSVQMMTDRTSEYIDVTYTLVNEQGELYSEEGVSEFKMTVKNGDYNPASTSFNNIYQLFNRKLLPEKQRNCYFKSLRYTIGNIPGNTYLYHTGANRASYSGGTIWGYVLKTDMSIKPTHSMRVYRVVNDEKQELTSLYKTTSVKLDNSTTVSYAMENAEVSDTTVTAGDLVTISGSVNVASYPYTSNNCLNDIMLGFILPIGAEINVSSIDTKGKLEVDYVKVITDHPSLEKGKALNIIYFKSGDKLGYYDEDLKAIPNGAGFTYSVQINTGKIISTQQITLKTAVFVTGKGRINGAGGSYSDHIFKDIFDANENGRTDDNIGGFGTETVESITINAASARLNIHDSVRKVNGAASSSITLDSTEDRIIYDLDIECTQGGAAFQFSYLIPVGKINPAMINEETFFAKNQVGLVLKEQPVLTTRLGTQLKVFYSTQSYRNYAEATAVTQWFDTLPDGKTWEDVTLIKIESKDQKIENGSSSLLSMTLGYDGVYDDLNFKKYAGMKVEWRARGFYEYELGYNTYSGTQSTDGCTVTVQYTESEPREFTLTAAKGTPESGQKSYSFELPEFILAQQYSLKDIRTSNMLLVPSNSNFGDMDSVAANQSFAINVHVKSKIDDEGNQNVDLLQENAIVGELDGNKAPVFTFELTNANALTDIVTPRYVEFTLIGNNGVFVPVKINIARELAAAEATEPAIVAGKMVMQFTGAKEILVSQDSAFTAQFITENMLPSNYENRSLVFEKPLSEGTTITFMDWTNKDDLHVYHTTLSGSQKEVPLKSFLHMGTNDSYYAESNATELVAERFLFLVQFPANGETIRKNTVYLNKTKKDGNQAEPSTPLTFTTVDKRTFSLSVDHDSSTFINETVKLTYESVFRDNLIDSRYSGRNLSLIIESSSSLPDDVMILSGNTIYSQNTEGKFIIPLESVQKCTSSNVSLTVLSKLADVLKLQCSIYASATSNGSLPQMGQRVSGPLTITLSQAILPSFKVVSMSQRILYPVHLASSVQLNYQVTADQVTVEVQGKDASGYTTLSTILEAVNGNTNHAQGVFALNPLNGNLSLRMNANASENTYRLLFKVKKGNHSIEVPYYFIITK